MARTHIIVKFRVNFDDDESVIANLNLIMRNRSLNLNNSAIFNEKEIPVPILILWYFLKLGNKCLCIQ